MIHSLREHIYSVLVVSTLESFKTSIMKYLPEATYSPVFFVRNIVEAQRETVERFYDLIIIDSPHSDDLGTKFAIDLSSKKLSVVLFFVFSENYNDIYNEVSDFGVFTVTKPFVDQSVMQALDFAKATRERIRNMDKKITTLEEKMTDIKLVNRAKWLLINSKNMSEDEAHRYIEKTAMDRCVSKRVIAEEILGTN